MPWRVPGSLFAWTAAQPERYELFAINREV